MQSSSYQGKRCKVNWLHTNRHGAADEPDGCSASPYDSFNLGLHVEDDPAAVNRNRASLGTLCGNRPIAWLDQVHGDTVVDADQAVAASQSGVPPEADAVYLTCASQAAGAVMTADCLAIVIFSEQGDEAGVLHAGWRGLSGGIIARMLERFEGRDLKASLGPTLCQQHFEVGPSVEDAFVILMGAEASTAFIDSPNEGKRLGDLRQLACMQLAAFGVELVDEPVQPCTHCSPDTYFSFRRDRITGRQASIVYID